MLAGAALAAAPLSSAPLSSVMQPLPSGQSHYMESCGGCHGLNGVSSRPHVPQLRDDAGYLLCTAEARDYALRLPNVAFAAMSPQQMADTMNFVAFDLGGATVPRGARRFTAREVLAARSAPLKGVALAPLSAAIKARALAACAAANN